MHADWTIGRDLDGSRPYLTNGNARIVGIEDRAGGILEALDGDRWRPINLGPVRCIADAERAIEIDREIGRARRAAKNAPRMKAFERIDARSASRSSTARSARGDGDGRASADTGNARIGNEGGGTRSAHPREEGARGRSIRGASDGPPPGFRLDDPEAIELARAHLARMRPSVAGSNGGGDLFAVAVALVRGFGLLPDGAASFLLEEYNRDAVPPWSDRELRRALVNAEAYGRMPYGVLFFSARSGGGAGEGRRRG